MFIFLKILFGTIFIILISWVMLHLLALFGVFLAIAYPLWWLLVPRTTLCLGCNTQPDKSLCLLCRTPVNKSDLSPKNFASSVKNALVILVISLLSLSVVYAESRLLNYLGIPAAEKTVSFTIPPKGQYKLGEIFPLKLEIRGIKTPINAIQTDLSFDPRKLQVSDISTLDSFANIFIQKEINNDNGYARLTGGLPNPGFFSDRGLFATVYLQGKEPGLTTLEFLPTSMVLANDGKGSNVLKEYATISYLILPETISAKEAEQQTVFFNTSILGASTRADQMTFYADPAVLGASAKAISSEDLAQLREKSQANPFLLVLEKINHLILTFWSKIFSLFTN